MILSRQPPICAPAYSENPGQNLLPMTAISLIGDAYFSGYIESTAEAPIESARAVQLAKKFWSQHISPLSARAVIQLRAEPILRMLRARLRLVSQTPAYRGVTPREVRNHRIRCAIPCDSHHTNKSARLGSMVKRDYWGGPEATGKPKARFNGEWRPKTCFCLPRYGQTDGSIVSKT
ncbi:hypothetical protein CIB48_g7889 [Xylaria polymorpha]|nr:hypothetical protein CIB48_g7889 [Xylaria polymorpha]